MVQTSEDLERLYRNGHRDTLNSDAEFWHDVALRLGQVESQRADAARRVAQYARLLRDTAAERDRALRGELCAALGLPESTSAHDLIRAVREMRRALAIRD